MSDGPDCVVVVSRLGENDWSYDAPVTFDNFWKDIEVHDSREVEIDFVLQNDQEDELVGIKIWPPGDKETVQCKKDGPFDDTPFHVKYEEKNGRITKLMLFDDGNWHGIWHYAVCTKHGGHSFEEDPRITNKGDMPPGLGWLWRFIKWLIRKILGLFN